MNNQEALLLAMLWLQGGELRLPEYADLSNCVIEQSMEETDDGNEVVYRLFDTITERYVGE